MQSSRLCSSIRTDLYDVAVIGGGPGGYACAIRAAQLGLNTVCIESRTALGGTCLNVGCIPSKILLNASHRYSEVTGTTNSFSRMGIDCREVTVHMDHMMGFKDRTVSTLTKGIDSLFRKNSIERITGTASLTSNSSLTIDDLKKLEAKHIVIATGSHPTLLPIYDGIDIISSDQAISLTQVPEHLVVIGGGIIGLELGSVWQRLGSKVTVVEHKERLLPGGDSEVAEAFLKILKKQGIMFKLGRRLVSAANGVVKLDNGEDLPYSKLLLAIGRRPHTKDLGLDKLGSPVEDLLMPSGHIKVDARNRTAIPNVYAIGDVAPGPMLAHKAEDEGIALAHLISGDFKFPAPDLSLIPSVVYTWPEVAWVGKSGKGSVFPFVANSRARVCGDTDGFVKVVTEAGKIVGAHVIGPSAGELIASLAMAVKYKASPLEVADISTAHPTLTEAVKEACLASHFRPIHF